MAAVYIHMLATGALNEECRVVGVRLTTSENRPKIREIFHNESMMEMHQSSISDHRRQLPPAGIDL